MQAPPKTASLETGEAASGSLQIARQGYARMRQEAERLAGANTDFGKRAAAYRALHRHSGGAFVFPLIAAHGALWGSGYFDNGLRLGRTIAMLDFDPARQHRRIEALEQFVDRFRDINHHVFVETWTIYQFTRCHAAHGDILDFVPRSLLEQFAALHACRRDGKPASARSTADLYESFFRFEQDMIVGPAIEEAVAAFEWPFFRCLALAPLIAFTYIPRHRRFRFRDMSNRQERIERGLTALRIANDVGFEVVETALERYRAWSGAADEGARAALLECSSI